MKKRILLTDTVHLNSRNFTSFFQAIDNNSRFEVHREEVSSDLVSAYGNYYKVREITSIKKNISSLCQDELLSMEERRINIFSICESELLSLITTKDSFSGIELSGTPSERFSYYFENHHNDLLINFAAGIYWIRRWFAKLRSLPVMHYSVVFSGSSISNKAFIALIKRTQCRNFVVESSLTGNDYYFEEKYDHIANNSDIKFKSTYSKALVAHREDPIDRQRENIKGINKLRLMVNKNVTQPVESEPLQLDNKINILLMCQVTNDYSVLEEKISTIEFYKETLRTLSRYECNVIVKLHPWENKKANLKRAFTKEVLEKYADEELDQSCANYYFVEDYQIKQLFDLTDFVMGLNTQSLIEAAFNGLKPLQFGNAFYGKKGFTHDYSLYDLDKAISAMLNGNVSGKLTLSEWENFIDFLSIYTCKQLVSIHKSGRGIIRERLSEYQHIELVKTRKPPLKNTNDIVIVPPVIPQANPTIDPGLTALQRKMRKFKRDPYGFFRDSNIAIARPVKHLFR